MGSGTRETAGFLAGAAATEGEEELGEVDAVPPGANGLDRSTQRAMAERHVIGAQREVVGERGIERRRLRASAQFELERGSRGEWSALGLGQRARARART
jgi:hypothetical protein